MGMDSSYQKMTYFPLSFYIFNFLFHYAGFYFIFHFPKGSITSI